MTDQSRTSRKAIASLLLAVLSLVVLVLILLDYYLVFPQWRLWQSPALFLTCLFLTFQTAVCSVILARLGLKEVSLNPGRIRGRRLALASLGIEGLTAALGAVCTVQALWAHMLRRRDDPPQLRTMNCLKTIALGLQAYADVKGSLPPPAVYGRDGKPLLSWRVLLLPYLEYEWLYHKFRLDEPWDSPQNLPLLAIMPDFYGTDATVAATEPHSTYYRVIVGPGTAFEEGKGIRLDDFPDGIQHTLLVVAAGKAVPWTRPEELAYDPDGPLPELGGLHRGFIAAALGDGRIARIPANAGEATFRALITRKGGDDPGPQW